MLSRIDRSNNLIPENSSEPELESIPSSIMDEASFSSQDCSEFSPFVSSCAVSSIEQVDSAQSELADPSELLSTSIPDPDTPTRLELLRNLHSFGHFGARYLATLANDQGIMLASL